MPKLPNISEIIATMKGSQGSARPGVTRRTVLKGAGDQVTKGMLPDAESALADEAIKATEIFKRFPELWDEANWGALDEAMPEDVTDAAMQYATGELELPEEIRGLFAMLGKDYE